MSLLFMDGFDAGDVNIKWRPNGTLTPTAGGRFGTGRYVNVSGEMCYDLATAQTKIFAGFAVSYSSANGAVFYVRSDNRSVTHITLWIKTDSIVLYRGGYASTVIATYTANFPVSTFHYLEISATIADAGGTCEIRYNGITVINYSGDTKNAGTNTTVDGIAFSSNSNTINVDDFWLSNDSGSAPHNTFLGDVRVYTMSPSGAGTTTQFTPLSGANYTNVDEVPYSATDYVTSQTVGQRDTYAMADLPAGVTTVYAVQNNALAKKTDAGFISLKAVTRSGSTNYYSSSMSLGTSDIVVSDLRTQDPNTSAAWMVSGVNALEAGMEVA